MGLRKNNSQHLKSWRRIFLTIFDRFLRKLAAFKLWRKKCFEEEKIKILKKKKLTRNICNLKKKKIKSWRKTNSQHLQQQQAAQMDPQQIAKKAPEQISLIFNKIIRNCKEIENRLQRRHLHKYYSELLVSLL